MKTVVQYFTGITIYGRITMNFAQIFNFLIVKKIINFGKRAVCYEDNVI